MKQAARPIRNTMATLVASALVASIALLAAPATAQGSPWQQECKDAWADAPASSYCSPSIDRRGAASDGTTGHCNLSVMSCSITVSVATTDGTENQTFTDNSNMVKSVADTDDVTLCFSVDDGQWTMSLNVGACASGEVNLSTATSTGLPAITAPNDDGTGDSGS